MSLGMSDVLADRNCMSYSNLNVKAQFTARWTRLMKQVSPLNMADRELLWPKNKIILHTDNNVSSSLLVKLTRI